MLTASPRYVNLCLESCQTWVNSYLENLLQTIEQVTEYDYDHEDCSVDALVHLYCSVLFCPDHAATSVCLCVY